MSTELEKALKKARYTALPLPRGKTGPTTIIAFRNGQLYVVRNAAACLPLTVTPDPAVDTIQFSRNFSFNLGGIVSFLANLFGIGKAKGDLEVRQVKSATIQLGGLSHETIQTGEMVDYLLNLQESGCRRDLLANDHLTIVAALKAASFRFTFKTEKGVTVKLSAEEATGLFKADASVSVGVAESGEIVVTAPAYVGVVTWDGRTMVKEIERARKAAARPAVRRVTAAAADVWSRAASPDAVGALRLASLGIRVRPAARTVRRAGRKAARGTRRRSR